MRLVAELSSECNVSCGETARELLAAIRKTERRSTTNFYQFSSPNRVINTRNEIRLMISLQISKCIEEGKDKGVIGVFGNTVRVACEARAANCYKSINVMFNNVTPGENRYRMTARHPLDTRQPPHVSATCISVYCPGTDRPSKEDTGTNVSIGIAPRPL